MRGNAARQVEMLTAVTPDDLIPQGHPMRRIKPMVDRALAQLSPTFARRYAQNGRASIPPEHLLKAGLLMALFPTLHSRCAVSGSAVKGWSTTCCSSGFWT